MKWGAITLALIRPRAAAPGSPPAVLSHPRPAAWSWTPARHGPIQASPTAGLAGGPTATQSPTTSPPRRFARTRGRGVYPPPPLRSDGGLALPPQGIRRGQCPDRTRNRADLARRSDL